MTTFDWIAVVGAAAWLYPLGQMIYKVAVRPKLQIMSAQTARTTFYAQGDFIALTLVLAAERKDALISRIVIHARHEKGEVRTFNWTTFTERFSDFRVAGTEAMQMSKTQPALALKVVTEGLMEREISFVDNEFSRGARAQMAILTDQFNYLKNHSANAEEELKNSRQMTDALQFLSRGMYWREGQFDLEFEVTVVGSPKPHRQNFTVAFTQADGEKLRSNLGNVQEFILAVATGKDTSTIQWVWALPTVYSSGGETAPELTAQDS